MPGVLPVHARVTKPDEWSTIPECNVMVTLELTYAEIDCLLSHLPVDAHLSVKLATAERAVFPKIRLVGFSKALQCTEIEARKLLQIAQEHGYSNATKEIQRCMRSCGR